MYMYFYVYWKEIHVQTVLRTVPRFYLGNGEIGQFQIGHSMLIFQSMKCVHLKLNIQVTVDGLYALRKRMRTITLACET